MLEELFIDNFVIIKREHIHFDQGFNVITGETGSGKSLVLSAVNLLLGQRANKDSIGRFSDKTVLEGVFSLNENQKKDLEEKDIIFDDNRLIITRTIGEKSSTVRINDRLSSLKFLQEISPSLIDIYNQRDSNKFLEAKNYLDILDSYENDKATKNLREELFSLSREKRKLEETFSSLDLTDEEIARERELISYQKEEIEALDLANLNEEDLDREYKLLSSTKELKNACQLARERLSSYDYDSPTVSSLLGETIENLGGFEGFDKRLDKIISGLSAINEEVDSLYSDLDLFEDGLEEDPERLEIIEDTNERLFDLKRKYGNSIEAILAYYDKMVERQKELENISDLKASFKERLEGLESQRLEKSQDLHQIRVSKAKRLEEKINGELLSLNIKNGKFKIDFKRTQAISENGFDRLDFLIRTNRGEELKSLSKTASGGELSRIMLAFKEVFSDYDQIDCLIFDEIDQGISGRSAQIVGEKILKISLNKQVIAISHLPQIASLANKHILIKKSDKENFTLSNATELTEEERVGEIARLIGGVDITEKTKESAGEMLTMADNLRRSEIYEK